MSTSDPLADLLSAFTDGVRTGHDLRELMRRPHTQEEWDEAVAADRAALQALENVAADISGTTPRKLVDSSEDED